MGDRPSALVVDDGELEDLREILDELRADYAHLRGAALARRPDAPRSLFVATARHAALADRWPAREAGGPTRIAVVAEDSNELRASLRRAGYDLLLRPPVHREALRLVLLRALYSGDERRRDPRASVGCGVTFRTGLRRRSAVLIELSRRGARLLASQPLATGSRVTLLLPSELVGEGAWLRAKVVRVQDGGSRRAPEHTLALAFEGIRPEHERALEAALDRLAEGPPTAACGAPDLALAPPPPAGATRAPARPPRRERRKHPRAAFAGEAISLHDEARRVLLGRDIGAGGMRVERQPGLAIGATLRLAIYARAGEPPIAVVAKVARDDGPAGMALRFEEVSPAAATRIEALVASLPAVEPLQAGECAAMGSVVSRVLEAKPPEA
jgi:hypothetical protein